MERSERCLLYDTLHHFVIHGWNGVGGSWSWYLGMCIFVANYYGLSNSCLKKSIYSILVDRRCASQGTLGRIFNLHT